MEEGFEKGQSNNLPKVDCFMVANYFIRNSDVFKMCGVKMKRSGRESYGDDAIGYVQVKRDGNKCTVKCQIMPEQTVGTKPNHCIMQCDEVKEEILCVYCEDCADGRNGCKHTVAFVMWLHRRTEEQSVKRYWKEPVLAGKGRTERRTSTNFNQFNGFGKNVTNNINEVSLEKLVVKLHNLDIGVERLSMRNLICKFIQTQSDYEVEKFLMFCKTEMTAEECKLVQVATIEQSNSDVWFQMRKGRVTASKAHEAAQCRTKDGSLVKEILGVNRTVETSAMKRGKLLEGSVKEEVEKLRNIKIKPSGLVLSANLPFFGASPDGVTDSHVVEIKCPSKPTTYSTYYKDGKLGMKCNAQIQTQMFLTGKEKGLFCMAHADFETTKKVDVYEVMFDKEYCDKLVRNITKFWKEYVYENLINELKIPTT